MDGATGRQKWARDVNGIVSSAAVAADGTVYVGSLDANLYALDGGTGEIKWKYATGDKMCTPPLVGPDGTVFIGSLDGWLYAIHGSAPLAASAWPMIGHDPQHTGRGAAWAMPVRFDRVSLPNGQFELRWQGPAVLQFSDELGGPWKDSLFETDAVCRPVMDGPQRFYRLRLP